MSLKLVTVKQNYFELQKSNSVSFTDNRTRNPNDFCITTTYAVTDENTTVKYLGVILDQKLTRESHVQYVVKKLCIAKGILSKLTGSKKCLLLHCLPTFTICGILLGKHFCKIFEEN